MEMTGMTRRTFGRIAGLTLATALVTAGSAAFAEGEKIAVITPYLSQPGTQFYVEAFEARARELGWEVNVIDTAGDVAAVISRMEDVSAQGVNAIVLNVDPAQVGAGLDAAMAANIPVFGMDAGTDPRIKANTSSMPSRRCRCAVPSRMRSSRTIPTSPCWTA